MSSGSAASRLAQLSAREAARQEQLVALPSGTLGLVRAWRTTGGGVAMSEGDDDPRALREATWIDLVDPLDEQRRAVGNAVGLEIPPPDAIGSSDDACRILRERGAVVVRALVVGRDRGRIIRLVPVTFILFGDRLITVRSGDARPFHSFATSLDADAARLASGRAAFVGLLGAIVGRAAERLQMVDDELEALSADVFDADRPTGTAKNGGDLRQAIRTIGHGGYLVTRVRQSLHSLRRAIPYLRPMLATGGGTAGAGAGTELGALENDIAALLDHDAHIMANATFLLDATLGLIDIQQSAIIKIFSVAAVILMPPTLIASIYGMNFKHMPELEWVLGYPCALALMVVSAVMPYLFFRRRGWL